jgi:hypothetical protein
LASTDQCYHTNYQLDNYTVALYDAELRCGKQAAGVVRAAGRTGWRELHVPVKARLRSQRRRQLRHSRKASASALSGVLVIAAMPSRRQADREHIGSSYPVWPTRETLAVATVGTAFLR